MAPRHLSEVEAIVRSSALFSEEEIAVALEVCTAAVLEGPASGYRGLSAESGDHLSAFAVYGPIPETDHAWDLYWIATAREARGTGVGSRLLAALEAEVMACAGRLLVAETSSREEYRDTRTFYERRGYGAVPRDRARLRDFYRPGDDRLLLIKRFERIVHPADALANGDPGS